MTKQNPSLLMMDMLYCGISRENSSLLSDYCPIIDTALAAQCYKWWWFQCACNNAISYKAEIGQKHCILLFTLHSVRLWGYCQCLSSRQRTQSLAYSLESINARLIKMSWYMYHTKYLCNAPLFGLYDLWPLNCYLYH